MEDDRTLNVLNSLAQGVDPETGEVLPRTSVIQQPDVIRALGHAVTVFRHRVAGTDREKRKQSRGRQRWTVDEGRRLAQAFDSGVTIEELAASHGRTSSDIQRRLVKLGRIENEGPNRNGETWKPEEDERLAQAFDSGAAIKELAASHERTNGAIRSRLVRLGRIERPVSWGQD